MIRIQRHALWLALLLGVAGAASSQPNAEDARKQYDAGNYESAAHMYQTLAQSTPRSAALYYNLGNALFKAGHIGRAIASLERAFDLRPRDGDIRDNLEFALRKIGEELAPPGVPKPLFLLFYWLSTRELAGLQWLACWMTLILGSLFLRRETLRPMLKNWLTAACTLWVVCGLWWLARLSVAPAEPGVIIASTAELRSGPGENFGVSVTAPEGRRVEVLTDAGLWLEVGVLKEGAKGWVKADTVERIW